MSEVRADTLTTVRLFIGKGGVGKTTLAARAALTLARSGGRSLLVSIDQAHSLTDVVDPSTGDRSVGREHRDVRPVTEGLDLLELNTLDLVESGYRSIAGILSMAGSGHEHGVRFGGIDPEEIVGAPGVQELLGLHRLVELVNENVWDTVFVDLPATADAMRTLQLPDLVCGYIERLWPQHDRVVAGTGTDPRSIVVVAAMERVVAGADAVRRLLFDRDRTTATIVLTAESVGVTETRRTLSAAALMGLPVTELIVNKLLPELNSSSIGLLGSHPAVFWFEGWRAAQQATLVDIERLAEGRRLVFVEQAVHEPVGLTSLGALETRVVTVARPSTPAAERDVDDRGLDRPAVARESGSGLESVYTMTMRLPVVDPATVSLGRVEDDVIIGADGVRARFRLASVLRRCVVVGAEFEAGNLVVRFQPDPAVWPV